MVPPVLPTSHRIWTNPINRSLGQVGDASPSPPVATPLLTLYKKLIGSKLDYGSFVYGSSQKSYLSQLNIIANQVVQICTGAFRTSPISSLQVISSEPLLHLRTEELAMKYIIKLQANPSNPTYDTIFCHQPSPLFNTKRKAISPLSIRMRGGAKFFGSVLTTAGMQCLHLL